ncbi:MAG TPA: outer membrane lipid asymmetry maintenance protein MlaD [Candidatus Udaeobacter sp.]|nr:outer membrane lipid asymmetry maintenance protein MlaD [Candidatus Udaeobacter sp.]
MSYSRSEFMVGFFVLIGIVCLGYLAIKLGKLEVLGGGGYTVYADFSSVAGLKLGDPVEIAGVRIGRVESMGLADDRARIQLRVEDGVKLQEDVIASVRARGLIGDKFVLLTPGASDRTIPPGGRIRETESPPDITDLIGKFVGGDLTSKTDKGDLNSKGDKKDEGPK